MKIWLSSDEHLDHTGIIKYCNRPWETKEEMAEGIIERFNSVVGDNDLTYHLGDFVFNKKRVELFLPRMKGKHILIPGNHDDCHPMHRRAKEFEEKFYKPFFSEVHERLVIDLHGVKTMLCHLPLLGSGDHTEEERYQRSRPTEEELKEAGITLLCHGHVHSLHRTKDNNMINVGVDVWDWKPVSSEEIYETYLKIK